jgi:hypothetical protein
MSDHKEFHHFQDGYLIEDYRINGWIRECLDKIQKGATHYAISSGDTGVVALKWDTSIEVIVSNSNGRSTLHFSTSPSFEDEIKFHPYIRPVKVESKG